jgi:hypothetical protein
MDEEMKLNEVLDQYVRDLQEQRLPQVYNSEELDLGVRPELAPLLELAAMVRAAAKPIPADRRKGMKAAILEALVTDATGEGQNWSMQRLVLEATSRGLEADRTVLTDVQVQKISSDTTTFDLGDTKRISEIVAGMAKSQGIRFFDLMHWVNKLVSNVLQFQSGRSSAVYARRVDENAKARSESGPVQE